MMPLKPLLKNKLLLQKHFHVVEFCIDEWPYWMFEENIKIVNEIIEEEEKSQESSNKGSNSMGNFNPNSYMKNIESMANKFK
jgi:hypothetical protein